MNTGAGGLDIHISRSASQMTLDSIDQITRYSEVMITCCVSKKSCLFLYSEYEYDVKIGQYFLDILGQKDPFPF